MAFMKEFKNNSVTVIIECQDKIPLVSTLFVDKLLNVKYFFLVKMFQSNNSVGATFAVKYAVDELEIGLLKQLM